MRELVIDATTGEQTVREAEPLAPAVPEAVSMRQARLALLQAELLVAVDAAIDAIGGDAGTAARIEWEYAVEVRRDSALIAALAPALGLDEAAIDALFVAAAGI